ncbi:MAG: hypothetical protein KDM91_21150 [Verrucomicrobiae bacterium]|nr:hypothetical protein [Verrucomicrobiae bacterium]
MSHRFRLLPSRSSAAALTAFLVLAGVAGPAPGQDAKPKWTPPSAIELKALIPAKPSEAAALIRKSWGDKAFASGTARALEKTTLLVAVASDEPVSLVRTNGGEEKLGDLVRLDDKGLHALAVTLPNCQLLDYELRAASGKKLGGGNLKVESYDHTSDSLPKEGVPKGTLHRHEWNDSKIFPDTRREYAVYVPAQYDGSKPAALMVFQDGLRHADPSGPLRATTVFDNLIASGEMPVTIGLFINPGAAAGQKPGEKPRNRGFEYDSLGDLYVRFLLEEIIPQIVADHGLQLSDDPAMRAIAGGSSGCACAWTAAWERPDQFGKVLGWVGTFVDIRGANAYPSLIRKTERKPIRAALLDGTNDLDNQFGNWPLANRQMETALAFQDYDFRYWWGECFHGSAHAGAMLPEMLKWLWRDWNG